MLNKSQLDAAIIGIPMDLHVPQSSLAFDQGVSALSEIPSGISIEECRDLILASVRSKAIYMLAGGGNMSAISSH